MVKLAQSYQILSEARLLGKYFRVAVYGQVRSGDRREEVRGWGVVKLAQSYQILSEAYTKVVDVMRSWKWLLGKYFRVAVCGQVRSGDKREEVRWPGSAETCSKLSGPV